MLKVFKTVLGFLSICFPFNIVAQNANFTTPDTICINQSVNISNISSASSHYWNFCVADILNTPPTGTNLGNPGNTLLMPVFSDFVEANGQFYTFVVNHGDPANSRPPGLVRLSFGNSLLNAPTAVNLGNFGGRLRDRLEGIQIINEGGQWYIFIVGGDPDPPYLQTPQIVRLNFGIDLGSTPTATDLGNLGNMNQPLDLHMFKENGMWHGFTVNKNGSITRFRFNNGVQNPPQAQNYPLNLSYPTGISVVNDAGNWYAFVTTATNNSLARLEFGNSLLNNPTVVNLGNPDNTLSGSRDITMLRFCDKIVGFAVNGPSGNNASEIIRLDFKNNLQQTPTGTSVGNVGNLAFPHSISRLFRVNDKVYSFITNVNNNSITRLEFPSCNNASQSSFVGANPPAITYNAPGVYNINLTTDDGLPSQSSFCRQVVVIPEPIHTPLQTIVLPASGSTKIGTANPSAIYQWFPSGTNTDSITVNSEGLYIVETSGYGCSNRDSFRVVRQSSNTIHFTVPDTVCVGTPVAISDVPTFASSYYWNFCVSNINETAPTGVNLGNVGNQLSQPVFMDYLNYNGNYYGFINNHQPSGLVRLDFGNSLLNTPTAVSLGNFGGIIPPAYGTGGLQVVEDNGRFYVIIVGGYVPSGSTPRIIKIDLGTNPANASPTPTNWGNVGGSMDQPIDLHIFKEGSNWYGFTTNSENNTLTRFSFGTNFNGTPTGENLGNFGGLLEYPTGVYSVNDNGNWRVFLVNGGNNTRSTGNFSLVRLDFGNSLLNTPTAVGLGNPGNLLQHPRDITILQTCGQVVALATNGHLSNNDIVKLDFQNSLTSSPIASSLGNIGNLNFPTAISKLFREGDNLYAFISNVTNNSITRLQFSGCTNSSIPSSASATPAPITYNAPGTYNINLTIDDGLATQASFCRQVVVVPQPTHTPLQTIVLPANGSVKIGTANQSASYQWFPSAPNTDSITVNIEGLYVVETSGYGCSNRDSFRIVFKTADFSFQQDPCNPLSVTFKNEAAGSTVVEWILGNGLTVPASNSVTTIYPSLNTYDVTLTIFNDRGLTESVTKSIVVQLTTEDIILTNDTTICVGSSIQLNSIAALRYCWTPSESLNASDIQNPIASPEASTTYYLNSLTTGNNLIINGDFSNGLVGFTSDYHVASTSTTESQYYVGTSSKAWNPHLDQDCKDHSGNGNMLLVNGAPGEDMKIWSQTITVSPNTNYAFSTWIESLFRDNPAMLQFSINGQTIGGIITASLPICNWTQFYTTWNSGTTTNAVISIINKNTNTWGNDFALDDISFAPVFIKRDSVIVNVEKPIIIARADTTICEGVSINLSATGVFEKYIWSPSENLADSSGASIPASPKQTTDYKVTATTIHGCTATDDVLINVMPAPELSTIPDTLLCGTGTVPLNTTGNAASYLWLPAINLSSPAVQSPVATPDITTKYVVTATSLDGCINKDSVTIRVEEAVVLSVSNDTAVCYGDNAPLRASGNADRYSWLPTTGLSDPSVNNPVANADVSRWYVVQAATDEGCNATDSIRVTVNPLPVVSLTNDTTICPGSTIQLQAGGGISYLWDNRGSLNNHAIAAPVASPLQNTTYTVTVTNDYNCSADESVTVLVREYPRFAASAGSRVICEGLSTTLNASGGDRYNWTPAEGLSDAEIANPVATPLTTTQYSVQISESICNFDTVINMLVSVSPIPDVVALKSNDINCTDRTSQLNATGANRYTWSPANNLNNPNRNNPVATVDTTTLFTVTGFNEFGCSDTDSVRIKVSTDGDPLFLLPNAFTPNNDGNNDCFGVSKWIPVQLQELSVYNRWGERVFFTKNPSDCWDGTYKGLPQASGTFVYVVKAKTFCGEIFRKGTINIIR